MRYTDTIIENRSKDKEFSSDQFFAELVQPNPWYKDVVPDV